MNLLFVHDHRFVEDNGVVYSNQFPAPVLERYLESFDCLTVVGRRQLSDAVMVEKMPISTTNGVDFVFFPNVSTLKSFLLTRRIVRSQIADLLRRHDRVIVRLPSELGLLTASVARSMNIPYAVELVGCPLDALWYYGTVSARLYAPILAARSRIAVRSAAVVCYVTESYLQRRYPAGTVAVKTNVSDVAILTTVDASHISEVDYCAGRIRIGVIGSLQTRYKGVHIAIEALAHLVRNGVDAELRVLGGGDPRLLVAQADQSKVLDRVFFDGTLPSGSAVHGWLDQLDIYVQPSLTEGLPRALIEAMSRGLPVVASRVGGIPELLGESYMFNPGDSIALADRLGNFVASPNHRLRAAQANLKKAREYLQPVLDGRRLDFHRAVKNCVVSSSGKHASFSCSKDIHTLASHRDEAFETQRVPLGSELEKIKLVIFINTAWNFINFRSQLVRSFVAHGCEVVAVAPDDEYSSQLSKLGCRYIPLSMDNKGTNPIRDLILLFRIYNLLRKERPDFYLGYTPKPNIYGSIAAHFLGISVINNVAGLGAVFIKGGWLNELVKGLYRVALFRSRKVFFQNDDDRQMFVSEGLVRASVADRLPGSGIDLNRFSSVPLEPLKCRGIRFLLVARMLWDKGVGEYVEAARLVRRMHPEAEFCLLGFLDVQNPAAISRKQMDLWVAEGVVSYLGTTNDVCSHIADADCVVLPSYREGVPRTLLEAAAMARPIIATDVVGCREVVDEGINGFLCEVRSAEDLAAKMLQMISLPHQSRRNMGLLGREKVEREFDEKIVIERYLSAIHEFSSRR